jgi:hypothetical protein
VAFCFLSNHYHLCLRVRDAEDLARLWVTSIPTLPVRSYA